MLDREVEALRAKLAAQLDFNRPSVRYSSPWAS